MMDNEKKNLTAKETFDLAVQNQQKNNLQIAKNLYKETLKINPNYVDAHNNLGIIFQALGELQKAVDCYEKAIQIQPEDAYAYFNLGLVFKELGEFQKAVDCYEKAIQIRPDRIEDVYVSLGLVFKELGEPQKAISCYEKAIEIQPNYAEAHNNLGVVFNKLEETQKAISCYEKAIEIQPNYAEAHNNLGLVFYELGEQQKAMSYYEKAIEIDPNYVGALNNLGMVVNELGEPQKAISCYEKAIEVQPNYTEAHNNLGLVFYELGEHQKAMSCYEKAIEIQPDHAIAHSNLSMLLLLLSDFDKGFEYYEWRKKIITNQDCIEYLKLNLTSKVWNGEDLNNKTILILSEQGFGDIFAFARYLFILKRKYETKVIFRVKKKLVHLFKKNEFEVISETDPLPQHDYHCLLLSLPKIFFEKEKKLAKRINYINVDEKIILKWKDKLSSIKGYKVGINWQGTAKNDHSRLRFVPLNLFETFFSIENLNFISLQKGEGSEQIQNFKHKDRLYDFMSDVDNKNAFEDTIGILKNLDLVITTDTYLAHVSSTLGVKTWVVLPLSPHWTWFLNSDRSLWYENTKLYRQKDFNRWESVFSKVKKDLVNLKNE